MIKRKQTVDVKKILKAEANEDEIDLSDMRDQGNFNFHDMHTVRKFKHAIKTVAGQSL